MGRPGQQKKVVQAPAPAPEEEKKPEEPPKTQAQLAMEKLDRMAAMASNTLARQKEMQKKIDNVTELCEGVKEQYKDVEIINERMDRKFKEKLEAAGLQIEMKDAAKLL